MFKIAQRILFLLNQNLYFFRETEPVGCVYKKGDLFEGIGSAVLEAGKSKICRVGGQAGHPGKNHC